MAYGYGLNATILQLHKVMRMLANHGVEMPLSLRKLDQAPQGKQVLDPKIADQVLLMFEQVTMPGGTATQANIPGYRVGGKTGTAHKLRADRKGLFRVMNIVPICWVAPVSDPRLAMIVVVENPQGRYYGGLVAAPVLRELCKNRYDY